MIDHNNPPEQIANWIIWKHGPAEIPGYPGQCGGVTDRVDWIPEFDSNGKPSKLVPTSKSFRCLRKVRGGGDFCHQHSAPNLPLSPNLLKERIKAERYQNSWIYFIEGSGSIKIGISGNPKKRLQSLSCSSPVPLQLLKVVPGDKMLESALHSLFDEYRTHGEWFKDNPRIRSLIRRGEDSIQRVSLWPVEKFRND